MVDNHSDERGKCRDILSDAMNALSDVSTLIKRETELEPSINDATNSIMKFLEKRRAIIENLRQECSKIDHTTLNDPATLHTIKVDQYVGLPLTISRIFLLLETWKSQKDDAMFFEEQQFARNIIRDIFTHLKLTTTPEVVFGDRFSAFEVEDHWFVVIPSVYLRRYERWSAIIHEVGHHYSSKIEIDKTKLLKLLLNEVPTNLSDEDHSKVKEILLNWIMFWLPELISDFVAFALFGLAYILDINHLHTGLDFGLVSKTHPPMSFRLDCLRYLLAREGIDLERYDGVFQSMTPISEEMDPIIFPLISQKLAPKFIDWLIEETSFGELEIHWSAIHSAYRGEVSDRKPFVHFASLVIESNEEEVTESFELLKKRLDSIYDFQG